MIIRWTFLLSVAISLSANAGCAAPANWARSFYKHHRDFYWNERLHNPELLTPSFGAALTREWSFARGEVGSLDHDPWLGEQDGAMDKPLKFSVVYAGSTTARVAMTYTFRLDPGYKPRKHAVHLILKRVTSGCWKLDDLITPGGELTCPHI